MSLNRTLRRTAGYTIDQTILIVAIIAILVTLIIITVGWNLINKTSGTKLASQMRQVEDANGQFYANYRTWPDQSYTTPAQTAAANIIALQGNTNAGLTFNSQVDGIQKSENGGSTAAPKNFLPGFKSDSITTGAKHTFGSGGNITELRKTDPFSLKGVYLVVQFANVPFSETQAAERAIDGDGNENYTTGRVVASTGDCLNAAPTGVTVATTGSTLVYACYAANTVQ